MTPQQFSKLSAETIETLNGFWLEEWSDILPYNEFIRRLYLSKAKLIDRQIRRLKTR